MKNSFGRTNEIENELDTLSKQRSALESKFDDTIKGK